MLPEPGLAIGPVELSYELPLLLSCDSWEVSWMLMVRFVSPLRHSSDWFIRTDMGNTYQSL